MFFTVTDYQTRFVRDELVLFNASNYWLKITRKLRVFIIIIAINKAVIASTSNMIRR